MYVLNYSTFPCYMSGEKRPILETCNTIVIPHKNDISSFPFRSEYRENVHNVCEFLAKKKSLLLCFFFLRFRTDIFAK